MGEGGARGDGATILHYQNGVWEKDQLSECQTFTQIDMIDETTGWILCQQITGQPTVLYYNNHTWQPFEEYPAGYPPTALQMLTAQEGWFISWNGILHYQNGNWQIFDNPTRRRMDALVMVSDNEGWAVGGFGILHYTNK